MGYVIVTCLVSGFLMGYFATEQVVLQGGSRILEPWLVIIPGFVVGRWVYLLVIKDIEG